MIDLTTYALLRKRIASASVRDGALVLTLADGQEVVYRPPAAPTFHVVDEMLQITYEEEVAPT